MTPVKRNSLKGSVRSVRRTKDGTSVIVRLQNTANRALHYISDVRALKYDPATRRLNVRLSDEGRVFIMHSMEKRPLFRSIDPGSEAEIRFVLPETIIKLAETATPSTEVSFEKHRIADATEIVVDIAWADVPYYEDPRAKPDDRLPTARWQKHALSMTRKMRPRRRGKKKKP